jgi:hypothetical protein
LAEAARANSMVRSDALGQTRPMWFDALTGFREHDVDDVAAQFVVDGAMLRSQANGRTMRHGRFEMPTLAELRERTPQQGSGCCTVREVVADAQALHRASENAGALFQVASQFNTLEMVSPNVTPEAGIDGYANDQTQGPACAIACGAGTIYRSYLVPIGDQVGQTAHRQLDGLADLAQRLGIDSGMRNGYALPSAPELETAHRLIVDASGAERDDLLGALRIGLQWGTEVTLLDAGHQVSQAYCSAVPVAYSEHSPEKWEPLARLVLDAAYEATLRAAALNATETGNSTVFLTLIGGGVFGNPTQWIVGAIERAVGVMDGTDLDVVIVSFGSPNPALLPLIG